MCAPVCFMFLKRVSVAGLVLGDVGPSGEDQVAQQEDRKLLTSAAGLQGLGTGERQEAPALTFHQVQKSDGRC